MFWQIELLYFVIMIAVFIVLLLWAKVPAGISLMASAIIGMILSAVITGTDLSIRHLLEGSFVYFDTILVVTAAMIFMGSLQTSGALDYFSAFLVKKLHKYPTLLLISFMIIIMFPGMITGSSLAAAVSAGALVAPIMIKMGIPAAKAGAIIAFGAILGMVAPPINVPVMVICDVVDIPFTGFTLPLLALTVPLAVFSVLFLGRRYVKNIDLDEMKEVIDFNILTELKWTVSLPIIILFTLIVGQSIFPHVFGILGMTLIFIIATIVTAFVGKKANLVKVTKVGVEKSFTAMALLMGVGMFVQVITLNGVRGFFVINALSLPSFGQYLSIAIAMPIFGGVSAFGSASILGGPFVMALLSSNEIIIASSLSLVAALGEFLPPTAMSATFAAKIVNKEKYIDITKAAIIPIVVSLAYAMLFIIYIAGIW